MTHASQSATRVVIPKGASECQVCGYLGVPGAEFHSYETCILYMLDHNPGRMKQAHKNYIWRAGIAALRDRSERKVLPTPKEAGA